MNSLEWVFSIVLAMVFLLTGASRSFQYEKAQELFPWVKDMPCVLVKVIGITEINGAPGLILPAATGIYPWLTP